MANPYYDVGIIGGRQKQGRCSAGAAASYISGSVVSVVRAAAYRSGTTITDPSTGQTYDYSRKEDVIHSEIQAPAQAPAWVYQRDQLWSAVDQQEKQKRKDAQLARSVIASLPRGLTNEQLIALARDHVQREFVAKGMIADFAVHNARASDGLSQPHLHVLLTMRDIHPHGFDERKNRTWNQRGWVKALRLNWMRTHNTHVQQAGLDETAYVDMRSYEERDIPKVAQIPMGYQVGQDKKAGRSHPIIDYNDQVRRFNTLVDTTDIHPIVYQLAASMVRSWRAEADANIRADYIAQEKGQQPMATHYRSLRDYAENWALLLHDIGDAIIHLGEQNYGVSGWAQGYATPQSDLQNTQEQSRLDQRAQSQERKGLESFQKHLESVYGTAMEHTPDQQQYNYLYAARGYAHMTHQKLMDYHQTAQKLYPHDGFARQPIPTNEQYKFLHQMAPVNATQQDLLAVHQHLQAAYQQPDDRSAYLGAETWYDTQSPTHEQWNALYHASGMALSHDDIIASHLSVMDLNNQVQGRLDELAWLTNQRHETTIYEAADEPNTTWASHHDQDVAPFFPADPPSNRAQGEFISRMNAYFNQGWDALNAFSRDMKERWTQQEQDHDYER